MACKCSETVHGFNSAIGLPHSYVVKIEMDLAITKYCSIQFITLPCDGLFLKLFQIKW
jgi:hypothetical protein